MPRRIRIILLFALPLTPVVSPAQWQDVEKVYNSGNFQKAVDILGSSIAVYPENAGNYIVRGMCYARLDSFVLAIQDYNHAIEINSKVLFTQMKKETYKDVAEEKRLLQDYENDLRWRPLSLAFRLLGDAHMLLLEYDVAVTDYDSALVHYSQNVEAYVNRGNANWRLNDRPKAIRDWSKAASLGNKSSQDLLNELGIRW